MSIDHHKAAFGLAMKQKLGDAGDDKRISHARQEDQNEKESKTGKDDIHKGQARWMAEMTTSMSLIPMNGAISPPKP